VSLDPPLVLWSLSNGANSMPIFTGNSHYVINVLNAEQAHLAKRLPRAASTRGKAWNTSCRARASPS
jgi:flavin reductase (DIM6/NTAB) family NADH-FMN oxidoreductase RutF